MRTLLNNYDCILEHEFTSDKKAKEGEIVSHTNKVKRVIFYNQKYDYRGFPIGSDKIIIDEMFLSELLKTINEIQSDKKDL